MDTKTCKILLVEDNPVDAHVVTEALTKTGEVNFSVTRAERLSEAIDRLRAESFDLVLLDFMLPDSEGLATFAAVQQQAPGVPIMALTALSDEKIAIEAVRQGALDVLVKGQVQPAALKRAVHYALTCPRHVRPE
jgi:CheY-like chemotaxis protein